jgi:hypothetical protein
VKTCIECSRSQPIAQFYKNGTHNGKTYYAPRCIPCYRATKGRIARRGRPPRVSVEIVDFLSIECGWWNAPAISDRIRAHQRGVQRHLEELAGSGRIRGRMTTEGAYEYQADPWWVGES